MPLRPDQDLAAQPTTEAIVGFSGVLWVYHVFAADAPLFAGKPMDQIAGPLWVFAGFKPDDDTYRLWISEEVPLTWRSFIILHELYEFVTPGGIVWDKRSDNQALHGPSCLDALGFEVNRVRVSGYDLQVYLDFRAEQLASMIAHLGDRGQHIVPLLDAVQVRLTNLQAELP